jgi:hypothetical protein
VSALRQFINATLGELPPARVVLNAGSCPPDLDREGRCYRTYFPKSDYYTLDRRGAFSEAHIVYDLMTPPRVAPLVADLVLCMSVLEHVENPFVAAANLGVFVRGGGHLFVSVPFMFPKHGGRGFGDFWRFTDDGLRLLFSEMREIWVRRPPPIATGIPDESGYCALFRKERT